MGNFFAIRSTYSIAAGLGSGLLLGAGGCTVYAPMQPVMPLVSQRGQGQAWGSLQPSLRLEAGGAYSPLRHCLVAGSGTVAFRTGTSNYLVTRQAEASLGGYWQLGPNWLVNALAGGGYAYTDRRYVFLGTEQYSGQHAKVFGQLGVAHVADMGSLSLSYRLARVQYHQLQTDTGPVADFGTARHEFLLSSSRALGGSPAWQFQTTLGGSFSSLRPPSSGGSQLASDRWFAAGLPGLLFSLGVVWQPGLISR